MRLRIRTSIREERPALLALGGVTAVVLAVLAAVFLLGDQRAVRIVATTPSDGATVSGTTPVFSLTFGTLVDRAEVERQLTITPASQFSTRWRGRTVELALSGSLPPASYTVSVAAGAIGANGNRFRTRSNCGSVCERRASSTLQATHRRSDSWSAKTAASRET